MSTQAEPERPIAVYIVEDDQALREDFARAVSASPKLELLGVAASLQQALQEMQGGLPLDVLLVDLGLPDGDGTNLISVLPQWAPKARALVISVFADDWRVLNALSAGAQGYLLKDVGDEELVRSIVEVARGDAPLSPQVARYLLRVFDPPGGRPAIKPGAEKLTPREAQILTLVSRGQRGPEVAAQLGLSLHTVNTHLRNCHAKLEAKNRVEALHRARVSGQIR